MLLAALTAATATAAPLTCPMAEVLDALAGVGPAPHPVVLTPPAALRALPDAPPPPDGKPVHGTRMDHHVDSRNFTVAWLGAADHDDAAERASDAAEAALAAFEDLGWKRPASSADYLLWIVLDEGLGAAGLTTEYTNAAYPDGYPVIFLDPALAADPVLWEAVVTHEVAHAVQFAYRELDGDPEEPWYWEASAEWATERARPGLDVYADSSFFLAAAPADAHWSMSNLRQYGMFVVNAHLHEAAGPRAMRSVWEAGEARPDAEWHALIAQVAGGTDAAVFGAAYAAWANGDLAESALYDTPQAAGVFDDGVEGDVGWLGARVYRVETSGTAKARASVGGVALASPAGAGSAVQVRPGDRVVVVGTDPGDNAFTLVLDPPQSGSVPDDLETDDASSGVSAGFSPEDEGGCATAPGSGGVIALLAALLLPGRRRRAGRPTGPGASSRTG